MPMGLLVALPFCLLFSAQASAAEESRLMQSSEGRLVDSIIAPLGSLGVHLDEQGNLVCDPGESPEPETCSVTRFADQVATETFEERWPGPDNAEQIVRVEAEIWTKAIQSALDVTGAVFIPAREKPYYLDGPVVLKSGHRLVADPAAEIRLKPGSSCCMVRNDHVESGANGPVTLEKDVDADIVIAGGIWTTLATSPTQTNGNVTADARTGNPLNSHGIITICHARRVVIRDVTVRQCKPHAIQISNCAEWCVARVRFEEQRRDGVHINGPASYGVIQDIRNARGCMGDDMVALNAWDWMNTSMSFGPIHHVLVEGVHGASTDVAQTDTRAEIRLLAGTKRFADGTTLDCNIENCVMRGIEGIRTFKMYDQPNLELGRDRDFAHPIGQLKNLHFGDIRIERPIQPALFQIAMDVDGMAVRDVLLEFEPAGFRLVQVGAISQTCKSNPDNPSTWVEIFSPDKDCTVHGLRVSRVRARSSGANGWVPVDGDSLVAVIEQHINDDYPNTTPRGGTGKGILLP